MKKIFFLSIYFVFIFYSNLYSVWNYPRASDQTIMLARALSKDIFELNGVPYLQPLVEVVNGSANARFFSSAYIPFGIDNLYIRFSVNGMLGFVPQSKMTYHPKLPTEPLDINKLATYLELDFSTLPPKVKSIRDTNGLIYYAFRILMYDGVTKGKINPPKTSPTILGKGKENLVIPHDTIVSLLNENPIFHYLPEQLKDTIYKSIINFPEFFELPPGLGIERIISGIPQLEFGSLFGTELTLRFVPPIDLGKNIGKFTFWGVGIKHSLTQYVSEPVFDLSLLFAYQGTNLRNTIGVTNAELVANASFWNFNIHLSKKITDWLEFYSGFSHEKIHINTDFTYYLPITVQYQLGLIWLDDNGTPEYYEDDYFRKNPELGYNGDPFGAMNKNVIISDFNNKITLGLLLKLGNFATFFDFNFGKINIFSFGMSYKFNFTKENQ
ncbi:MAG: hypothetical protein N2517_06860 [Ignavibacteria bacterium]|nr:hypothetical protein [Ignavibacteria bacterium]